MSTADMRSFWTNIVNVHLRPVLAGLSATSHHPCSSSDGRFYTARSAIKPAAACTRTRGRSRIVSAPPSSSTHSRSLLAQQALALLL